MMAPIKDSLIEALFPALFGWEEFSSYFGDILGRSVKCGGPGIPDPQLSEERNYNASKSASEVLVGFLLGGTDLKYVAHKGCVRRASSDRWKQWDPGDALDGALPLDGGGKVCVQLLQALGAASFPPAR